MVIADNTDTVQGRVFTSGTTTNLVGATVITDGKWHHAALVYNGSTGEHSLYIDGKLDAQETEVEEFMQYNSTTIWFKIQ